MWFKTINIQKKEKWKQQVGKVMAGKEKNFNDISMDNRNGVDNQQENSPEVSLSCKI